MGIHVGLPFLVLLVTLSINLGVDGKSLRRGI